MGLDYWLEQSQVLQNNALGEGTNTRYDGVIKYWFVFCEWMGSKELFQREEKSVLENMLIGFAVFCFRYGFHEKKKGNCPNTVIQKLSAIKHYHRLNDVNLYDLRFLKLGLVIKGMCKMYPKPTKKKAPISLKLMETLFKIEGCSVMWCIVVLCYVFMLRIHEITRKTNKAHSFYCIRLGDLMIVDKEGNADPFGDFVRLNLRGSKTDQAGQGIMRIMSKGAGNICCVKCVEYLKSVCKENQTLVCDIGGKRITSAMVRVFIKKGALLHGADVKETDTHSLRSGGATRLFQMGVNPLHIQFIGRWLSDEYLGYCHYNAEMLQEYGILLAADPIEENQ